MLWSVGCFAEWTRFLPRLNPVGFRAVTAVKPVAVFENSLVTHLTASWGDVVEAAPLDSDDGYRLFQVAAERTGRASRANTHIYLTEGDPLVTLDDVEALQAQMTDCDEEY